MFHRFTLNGSEAQELVAVGVVMPSGTVFVEYLERDVFDEPVPEAEAYPTGVEAIIGLVENESDVVFMWEDDPDENIDQKVETTAEDIWGQIPDDL
jgi:hypothetical protein